MKFKIKSYGIDTENLGYLPLDVFSEDYIHISGRSGNAFFLSTRILETTKILYSTEYLDSIIHGIDGLLEEIGRQEIEALLLGPGCDIENHIPELKYLLNEEKIRNIGFYHPTDLMRLKESAEKIKQLIIPRYIQLSISPVYFQKPIIDWAESENLAIVGDNPFGGYLNSGRAITSFTAPYLLGFSGRYSDIVLLSSRDIIMSGLEEEYLAELINKDCPEMYELEIPADHRVKPFKKMIYTTLENSIPFTDPQVVMNYSDIGLNFSDQDYRDPEKIESLNEQEKSILEYVKSYYTIPRDGNLIDYLGIVRPEICRQLKKDYSVTVARLGPEAFILKLRKEVLEKRFMRKSKKQEILRYLLLTVNKSGELILRPYT